MTDFPGAAAAGAATPGVSLAAARKASGLSIDEVAAQMRISPRQVQAIEADQYDRLPGAVFVRGFVRNYARLLKIDPVPLLHALEPALGDEAPLRAQEYAGTLPVPVKRNHARVWLAILGVLLASVLGAGAYEYWRARRGAADSAGAEIAPPAVSKPVVPAPAPPVAAIPAPVERGEPLALTPERVPDSSAANKEGSIGASQDVAPAASTAAAVVSQSQPANAPRVDRITIEFVQESWLELRDRAGKVVYSGIGAANTSRRFEAEGPLSVVIGNAPGVRITYNEKRVDMSAYTARNIARFTLE